ncbi:MAG: CoA transferase subunit A [Chloroflexi bacterium]|nr:CoA transferase subunit A [Chloroflexota bacterium]
MKNKILPSFEEAVADISDGASVMVFHWGMGRGTPQNLIRATYNKGVSDLIVISHNFISAHLGGRVFSLDEVCTPLMLAGRAKKVITAWATDYAHGKNKTLENGVAGGRIELELTSHGNLIERVRAGGSGLGGFYSPVGVGTFLEEGKEKRVIDGKEYLLEKPLRADFAFVRAYKADTRGNLVYRGSVRGSNPIIAMAADVTIAEVDEIVEVGELDPETIVTPAIFVDRIVKIAEDGFGSTSYMQCLFRSTMRTLLEGEEE